MTMGFDTTAFHLILDSGFHSLWNNTPISYSNVAPGAEPHINRQSLDAAGVLSLVFGLPGFYDAWCRPLQDLHNYPYHSLMISLIFPQDSSLYPATNTRSLCMSSNWWGVASFECPHNHMTSSHWCLQKHGWTCLFKHQLIKILWMPHLRAGYMNTLSVQFLHLVLIVSGNTFYSHCLSYLVYEGTIIAYNLNAPGSWYDSWVACPIYEKLCTKTPEGFYLVTDIAFPHGTDQIASHIWVPMKDGACLPSDVG